VLAARFLRDAGTRTAISVGALITAMALFVALVIMVHSFRRTVEVWVEQTVSGDVFVRPAMAGSNDYRDALPEAVVATCKACRSEVGPPVPADLSQAGDRELSVRGTGCSHAHAAWRLSLPTRRCFDSY
jgi:hypothetical protein